MPAFTNHNESLLISHFREGRYDAFRQVYNKYQEKVFLYAKRYVEKVQDAEDFTADVFLQLWQLREQQHSLDAIAAFLHVAVRNKCFDYLRREKRWTYKVEQLEAQDPTAPLYRLSYSKKYTLKWIACLRH